MFYKILEGVTQLAIQCVVVVVLIVLVKIYITGF